MSSLKELIKNECGVELPISGGFGSSIKDIIIVHRTDLNEYVRTEKFILECIGEIRDIEWSLLRQELHYYNEKKIDKIKIETKEKTNNEIITQIEDFYFDITDCIK